MIQKDEKSNFRKCFRSNVFSYFSNVFEGMPKSTDTWVEYGIKSVAIAVIFLITEGIFSKKSLKKNTSNQ